MCIEAVDQFGNKLYHKADSCPQPKIFDEYCPHADRYISECYCPAIYQYTCVSPYRSGTATTNGQLVQILANAGAMRVVLCHHMDMVYVTAWEQVNLVLTMDVTICGIVVNWIRNKHPLISSRGVFLYKNQEYGISNAIKKSISEISEMLF